MADDEQYSALEATLDRLGGFGCFQRRTFASATLIYFVAGLNNLGYIFWAARPAHWCDVTKPAHLWNVTDAQWEEAVIPRASDGSLNECFYRKFNWSHLQSDDALRLVEGSANATLVDSELAPCDSWTFDRSQYTSTIVMDVINRCKAVHFPAFHVRTCKLLLCSFQMQLVCDRFWLRSATQSVFFLGLGFGLITFGQIGDR